MKESLAFVQVRTIIGDNSKQGWKCDWGPTDWQKSCVWTALWVWLKDALCTDVCWRRARVLQRAAAAAEQMQLLIMVMRSCACGTTLPVGYGFCWCSGRRPWLSVSVSCVHASCASPLNSINLALLRRCFLYITKLHEITRKRRFRIIWFSLYTSFMIMANKQVYFQQHVPVIPRIHLQRDCAS